MGFSSSHCDIACFDIPRHSATAVLLSKCVNRTFNVIMDKVKHRLHRESRPVDLSSIKITSMKGDVYLRVRAARKALNLNQEDFGKCAGVTKQAVSAWERDINEPERDALLTLEGSTHIDPRWIASGEGLMFLDVDEASKSADTQILIEIFEVLTEYNKKEVISYAKSRAMLGDPPDGITAGAIQDVARKAFKGVKPKKKKAV